MIVGIPGMGNSEPSWHQRRPFGFSKSGLGKAQARIQTLRRPSTAYARLGSTNNKPYVPRALVLERAEYWGSHGAGGGSTGSGGDGGSGGGGARGTQDLTIHGVPTGYSPSGCSPRVRVRPATAGPHRSSVSPTALESATTAAAAACVRNRAGIVRNCRGGLAAPPPTPPLPTTPASSPAPPTAPPLPHRPIQEYVRRRPSTAGPTRPSARHVELVATPNHATTAGAAVDRTAASANAEVAPQELVPRHGVEVGVGSPVCVGVYMTSGTCEKTPGVSGAPDQWDTRDSSRGQTPAAAITIGAAAASNSESPSWPDCCQQRWGGDDNFAASGIDSPAPGMPNRGRSRTTTGKQHVHQRRRPASAVPARTTSIELGGDYGRDSGGGGGGGVRWGGARGCQEREMGDCRWDSYRRPRSASAVGERRGYTRQSPSWESSSAVAICVGEAEWKDLVRRDATSRTRHPPPVVPDFVISEKQVLRFFGHLSEELAWGCEYSPGEDGKSLALKIRQVVLTLFLADGSLEIFETRQVNSGEQGGLLVKRNLFRKRDGSYYGVRDLKLQC